MALPRFNFATTSSPGSGWTAATLAPNEQLQDATLSTVDASVTGAADALLAPDVLRTTPQALGDPTLGSRAFRSSPQDAIPVARTSVYQTPNAPAFLADAVARLNATQAGQQTAQQRLVQQLLGIVGGGNPNAYLVAPALAAAAGGGGGPGSGGLSLAPIQNPLIGQGYSELAKAQAGRATAQTTAINRVNDLQSQILDLKRRQAQQPQSSTFSWGGSGQNTANKIFDLEQQLKSAQQLGTAAASSGWGSMAIPGY